MKLDMLYTTFIDLPFLRMIWCYNDVFIYKKDEWNSENLKSETLTYFSEVGEFQLLFLANIFQVGQGDGMNSLVISGYRMSFYTLLLIMLDLNRIKRYFSFFG